jgi:hypothetical protein
MLDSDLGQAVRILNLMAAASRAGLTPIGQPELHALAYLVNALSPVWELEALDEATLKLQRGPFYASVQQGVDRLVGMGLVSVSRTEYEELTDGRVRFSGWFEYESVRCGAILREAHNFEEEQDMFRLALEVCLSASAAPDEIVEVAMRDLDYSDLSVSGDHAITVSSDTAPGRTIAFAEHFSTLMPTRYMATPASNTSLYIKYLQRAWDRSA